MQQKLSYKRGTVRVIYETDPYNIAAGPLRSMQKYAVIALTTKGTDTIRPWFGTNISTLPIMNIYNAKEIELFIRDEVKEATRQFFILQNGDYNLTADDIIDSIELKNVVINTNRSIKIEILFYPLNSSSISLSLEV